MALTFAVAFGLTGMRAHVRGRCAIAAAEYAIEIGDVGEASVVSDGTDLFVTEARIHQHPPGALETLHQHVFGESGACHLKGSLHEAWRAAVAGGERRYRQVGLIEISVNVLLDRKQPRRCSKAWSKQRPMNWETSRQHGAVRVPRMTSAVPGSSRQEPVDAAQRIRAAVAPAVSPPSERL